MQLKLSGLTKKGVFRKRGIRKLNMPSADAGMKKIRNPRHMRFKIWKASGFIPK